MSHYFIKQTDVPVGGVYGLYVQVRGIVTLVQALFRGCSDVIVMSDCGVKRESTVAIQAS